MTRPFRHSTQSITPKPNPSLDLPADVFYEGDLILE